MCDLKLIWKASKFSYFFNQKLPQVANKIARITAQNNCPKKYLKHQEFDHIPQVPSLINQSIQLLDLPWS